MHLHHGTRESPARLAPLDGDVLRPGVRSYVQIRLERPVVPETGDRFVLRQLAPPDTVGGGVVLDPAPRKHGAGAVHVERLRMLERGDPLERLEAELAGAVSGLTESDGDPDLLERLRASGSALRVGTQRRRYFAPARLVQARARLLGALERAGSGLPVSRGALADAAGLSDLAVASLLEELVATGDALARGPGFTSAAADAPDDLRSQGLLDALREDGLEPRDAGALGATLGIGADEARELLEGLTVAGRVVRVKPGIYYHPAAIEEVRGQVRSICRREGSVTIAELRDELGTSRKYAQALLEHFDAERLTRRMGDTHVLRRER